MCYQDKRQALFQPFLLGGKADTERVWWGDQQTHRGNQHVQTPRSRHKPLAALRVILQDALIPFKNSFLKDETEDTNRGNTELYW